MRTRRDRPPQRQDVVTQVVLHHCRHETACARSWRYLLVLAVVLTGSVAVAVAVALATGSMQRDVLLGAGATFTAWTLAFIVVLVSGTAPLIAGGLAERWTALELRPLREHGWRLVHHAGLAVGDLDHVVSDGYLAVVETLTVVVPVTTVDRGWPDHVELRGTTGPAEPSWAMTEQPRVVDRGRLVAVAAQVDDDTVADVGVWLRDVLALA